MLGDPVPVDQEALIKEARRRARRRRQRNLAGVLAAIVGALWLYSLVGGSGPESGSALRSEPSSPSVAHLKAALPEQLSFNANNGVVLVRRDGTREDLAPAVIRQQPNGKWHLLRYFGVEWSPDGSKLLAMRYQSPERPGISLVAIDANGKVGPMIARHPVDGRWSPNGTEVAFVRHEPGAGRVLFVASSAGRTVTRIADHLHVFGTSSWSPDGTELAYGGQGTSGLFVADASGRGSPRAVPLAAGTGAAPKEVATVHWSPDGSLIAFTASDHVYVVRPDGTSLRRVAVGYDFAWSPDGTRLAVVGPPGGRTWAYVSVVRSDGTGLHRIAGCRCDLRGPGFSQSLAWSSNGTRIAYIGGRGNTVSTIRPDGSGPTAVATQTARGLQGIWYPSLPLWRPSTTG